MCKVTVITVTYNACNYIEDTMNSVLAQKYEDFEYIIKDGISSDNTNDIVDNIINITYNKKISVKHIISEDKGIYDAMNEAVQYASGEWIIFMNAGDVFYNDDVLCDIFSIQYENHIGVLYGHAMIKLIHNRGLVLTYNLSLMNEGYSLCHQSVLEKREYLIEHPFDSKLKILGDRDHLLYLMTIGVRFQKINIIVVKEDRSGISAVNYSLFSSENNLVNKKYNLECKRQSIRIGKIKMIIKKLFPQIEEYVMIKKALKRTG